MTNIKCTIKEPHSHLVHGVTFGCEQGADVMDKPKEEWVVDNKRRMD